MPTEWSRRRVSELQSEGTLLVEDGNHGEYRPRLYEYGSEGVPFIRIPDMGSGYVDFPHADKIGPEARARIRKGVGAAGDVLVSHKGTIGKVAFAPLNSPEFVCSPQTTFWRSLDQDRLDRRYLFYYLQSPDFQGQLDSRKNETDMAGYVSLTAQRSLTVLVPDIHEQRYIARVLGSLDDKIELNRRMSQTLEHIAQALFKSWFVDFEPVRAKAEGRWKGGENMAWIPADTWDLWPSEFRESDIGVIPKGWQTGTLEDMAEVTQGSTPSTAVPDYWQPPEIDWVTVKDLSTTSHHVLLSTERRLSRSGLERVGSGILPPGMILLSTGAPIGYFALNAVPTALGTRVAAIQPRNGVGLQYLLHWVASNTEALRDAANGTTFPQLLLSALRGFPLIVPSREVVCAFDRLLRPIGDRLIAACRESTALAHTRDALLPKLLSGEIRVPVDRGK